MNLFASLLAHLVGDYLLQTHHMATEKTKRWTPAILHGVVYTLPFVLLTQAPLALLVICITHIILDRYRIPRYLIWFKNQFAPKDHRPRWEHPQVKKYRPKGYVSQNYYVYPVREYNPGDTVTSKKVDDSGMNVAYVWTGTELEPLEPMLLADQSTGYPENTPAWLSVWLLIITDNTLHLLFNTAALTWLS